MEADSYSHAAAVGLQHLLGQQAFFALEHLYNYKRKDVHVQKKDYTWSEIVLRMENDSPHLAFERNVSVIVAASCNIDKDSPKFLDIAAKFKGSIYMLKSAKAGLYFDELSYDDDPSRVCFIIPAEQSIGAIFDPFPELPSSSTLCSLKRKFEPITPAQPDFRL